MDTKKTFEYFDIDDIYVSEMESTPFYPIIEGNEEGEDVLSTATGFYIKTMPKSLRKVLLPSDTKLKDKSKTKEVKKVADPDKPIDIYKGALCVQRLKAIDDVAIKFNITKSAVREIFCYGADWAIALWYPNDKDLPKLKKGQK